MELLNLHVLSIVTALILLSNIFTAIISAQPNGTARNSGDTVKIEEYLPETLTTTAATDQLQSSEQENVTRAILIGPTLSFDRICDPLGYSGFYKKHKLSIPIRIQSPINASVNFTVIKIEANVDETIKDTEATVKIIAQLKKQPELGVLIFLCNSFARCQQIKEAIDSDPEELWRSIKFSLRAKINTRLVRFDGLQAVNVPEFSCNPRSWTVFQRRVDSNLSFVQNWNAYVNGFGSPDSNYWMGLDKLFIMTATTKKSSYHESSRCRLRVELRDFKGTSYWGEYGQFQVLDAAQNYRLRLGQEVAGSQLSGFVDVHNESPFSTYERKHDRLPGDSCSQLYGYGGWWYGACHYVNLNGAYLTDESVTDSPIYASFRFANKFVPVKFTEMKFKCR